MIMLRYDHSIIHSVFAKWQQLLCCGTTKISITGWNIYIEQHSQCNALEGNGEYYQDTNYYIIISS